MGNTRPSHHVEVISLRVRVEVSGLSKIEHNEGIPGIYSSLNGISVIVRRLQIAGHMTRVRDRRNEHGILAGKPFGKPPF
jgi:hypothetical protein